jgi:hypothetical protein
VHARPAAGAIFTDREGENVAVHIAAVAGDASAGAPVLIKAVNLRPSSPLIATVYSDPLVILRAVAGANGEFVGSASIPSGLAAGRHTVVLEAQDASGVRTVAGTFTLQADGTFERIVQPRTITSLRGPGDRRLDRAAATGRSVWDPRSRPLTTAGLAVAAMSFIALAGAGGLAGGGVGSGQTGGSSPSRAPTERAEGGRKRNARGKLAGVVTKKLKGIQVSSTARGDLSGTWALPATARTDQFSSSAPGRLGKWSSAAPRVVVDGAWLRAILGSFGFSTWLVGLALGTCASFIGTNSPLTPTAAWLAAIVALGTLDAGAGQSAWFVICSIATCTGWVRGWADIRTMLGLFVLLVTPSLLAHVIRPLRRYVAENRYEAWERGFDYVMMPVFVAFASGSMLKALNGLSGLEIVHPRDVSNLRWVVYVSIIVRLACEDLASHWYPERMRMVQPAKLVSPNRIVTSVSIVLRSLVFLLVCEPFFGITATTVTAMLLLAAPVVLKMWEDELPNSRVLNKWFPRGLFRFWCTLILGSYLSWALIGRHGGASAIKTSFVWLLLPGVIIGIVELFGRSGGDWPNVRLRRILGAAIWVTAMLMVTGHLTLFG